MIIVEDVGFRYDKSDWVLKKINLNIEDGSCTFIIGPNGGGKTTLGKLMTGILKPTVGNVIVGELNTRETELYQIGAKVGYLFQEPERQIFAATVRDELAFVMELLGVEPDIISERVEASLARFELKDVESAFVFQLSRGEKQRLAMAAIMINNPAFLILDEPTTGLDAERKEILSGVVEQFRAKGTGMIIISHDHKFVDRHADRVIHVAGGEIIDDRFRTP